VPAGALATMGADVVVGPGGVAVADLASPPAVRLARPRWLDLRFAGGVALLVVSLLGVSAVINAANRTTSVWVASRPLAAGLVVGADDVHAAAVHLTSGMGPAYLSSSRSIVGSVLTRPVGVDELVPARAVAEPGSAPARRLVTVSVPRYHYPTDLAAGDVVDVYVVPGDAAGSVAGAAQPPKLVLDGVVVSSVDDSGSRFSAGSDVGVALAVPPADVAALVSAAARGTLTLVAVPDSGAR
jgi:Flp pilus assembly protein CpaB